MKQLKRLKGSATLWVLGIVGVLVLASGASYYVYKNNYSNQFEVSEKNESLIKLTFKSCVDVHYEEDIAYDFWKSNFISSNSEFKNRVFSSDGEYCELSNGNHLVSFDSFNKNNIQDGLDSQIVALFDVNKNFIKRTKGFSCKAIGETTAPRFETINDNKVNLKCSSGDAGHHLTQYYELDLTNFMYKFLSEKFESAPDFDPNYGF